MSEHFYGIFSKAGESKTGFGLTNELDGIADLLNSRGKGGKDKEAEAIEFSAQDEPQSLFFPLIEKVFATFLAIYDTLPMVRSVSKSLPVILVETELKNLFERFGEKLEDRDGHEIYRIPSARHYLISPVLNRMKSLNTTKDFVDSYFILGLVSLYDDFIRNLAEVVIQCKPHIVFAGDKQVKITDIQKHSDLASFKRSLIETIIVELLRSSHLDQLKWFEEKLDMKLQPKPELLQRFVELTQRRHLFAHAGGKVSTLYLEICQANSALLPSIKLGDQLRVSESYFRVAVETLIEISAQLVHVIWQKVDGKESESAAQSLVNITYGLIRDKKYDLAIRIIEFVLDNKSTKMTDATRKIHLINHANAKKLKGDADFLVRANAADWSSIDLTTEICLAALRDQTEAVVELLPRAIAAEAIDVGRLRAWPIFEKLRQDEEFLKLASEIVGSSIIEIAPVSRKAKLLFSLSENDVTPPPQPS